MQLQLCASFLSFSPSLILCVSFIFFFFFSLKWVGIGNHTWLLLWMTTENRTRSQGPGNKRVFFFGGISEGLTEAIGEPWTLAKDFIWFSAVRGFHTEYLLIKPLRKFCSCRKLCQNQFFFFLRKICKWLWYCNSAIQSTSLNLSLFTSKGKINSALQKAKADSPQLPKSLN